MLTHVIFTILCVFCLRFRSEISERRRLLYLLWENDRHLLPTQWILMISNRKKINWISSEMTLMALRLSSSLWLNKTNDTTRMAREKDWKKSRTKSDNVIKFKERHQVEMGRDDDDVSGVHIQKKGEIIGKLILSLFLKRRRGRAIDIDKKDKNWNFSREFWLKQINLFPTWNEKRDLMIPSKWFSCSRCALMYSYVFSAFI